MFWEGVFVIRAVIKAVSDLFIQPEWGLVITPPFPFPTLDLIDRRTQ